MKLKYSWNLDKRAPNRVLSSDNSSSGCKDFSVSGSSHAKVVAVFAGKRLGALDFGVGTRLKLAWIDLLT